jgi:hypothetical protein
MLIVGALSASAKEKAIIFKGQAVKFEKKPDTDTLCGRINGKDVIATTKYNDIKNTKHYLGAFRKLKRKQKNQSKKKLVTYHVFEKLKTVIPTTTTSGF